MAVETSQAFRVITISGEVATGTTSITQELLRRLSGWTALNSGNFLRELMKTNSNSIQNVSDLSDDVHMEIDRRQRELAINESNLILEGRLAGWLTSDLRHVFRVLCYCPLHVRITRYMQREHCDESTAIHQIEERDIGDRLKYRKIYGVYDYRDSSFYTMLVDTSVSHPDDLAFEILSNSGLINIT